MRRRVSRATAGEAIHGASTSAFACNCSTVTDDMILPPVRSGNGDTSLPVRPSSTCTAPATVATITWRTGSAHRSAHRCDRFRHACAGRAPLAASNRPPARRHRHGERRRSQSAH
eukprot:390216-Prymnesium_polylepis.2